MINLYYNISSREGERVLQVSMEEQISNGSDKRGYLDHYCKVNSKPVLNGQKEVGCQMLWYLNTGQMDATLFSYVLVWYFG